VSELDDLSLVLIVERGAGAVDALPPSIRKKENAVAETLENNVRRLIIGESPINPKCYWTGSDDGGRGERSARQLCRYGRVPTWQCGDSVDRLVA
jgi:hypothetical protein